MFVAAWLFPEAQKHEDRCTIFRLQRLVPWPFVVEDLAQVSLIDELAAIGARIEMGLFVGGPCSLPGIGGPRSDSFVIG
ncbi:hypothetical protein MesoLj113c_40240 [Mesorhizobium sp. 113-3-9]|nr:hypothetical protein MesoLj113c_40240 [Mesorhizobium sp. 113-3-9]